MYNLNIDRLTAANILLETLHAKVSSCAVPDFGGNMLSDDDRADVITLATVKHRIVNKFEPSADTNEALLRAACNAKWIAFETELRNNRIYSRTRGSESIYRNEWWTGLTPETKSVLFKAREMCHSVLKSIKIDLHNAQVEFTPGETNVSAGGKVSVEEKLKCLDQWTVTGDAADDFIRLCYHNYSLKSAAKAHFPDLTPEEKRSIEFLNDYDGFSVFSYYMNRYVLTIVPGSVGDSVYKNRKSRRFINKEPMGNMILQRLAAFSIRRVFNSKTIDGKRNPLYNPLDQGQARHKAMIMSSDVSTVDWENASDSVHVDGPKFLFPSNLNGYLFKYRSPMVLISEGKVKGKEQFNWYLPEKLCSMGNGYCFEVLTLVLLCLARVSDEHASVYGDDVIIKNDSVDQFVLAAQALGFKLNVTKSFIRSPYRESCGAFYYEPVGYITSYDVHRCTTETDIVITCNKLSTIIVAHPFLKELLHPTWDALTRLLPPSRIGPFPAPFMRTSLDVVAWVGQKRYKRAHMSNVNQRALRNKLIEEYGPTLSNYSIKPDAVNVVEVPVFKPKELGNMPSFVKCPFKRAMYMYSGRRTKNTLRPKPDSLDPVKRNGRWISTLYFVLPEGRMLKVKDVMLAHKELLHAIFLIQVCGRPEEKDFLFFEGGDA